MLAVRVSRVGHFSPSSIYSYLRELSIFAQVSDECWSRRRWPDAFCIRSKCWAGCCMVSCTITLALRAAHSTVCCIYVHTAAAAGHDMEGEEKEVEDLIIFWGGNWLAVSETKFRQGQIQNSRICAQSALTELPGNSFSSSGYPTHTRRQQRAKQINRKQIFK